MCIIKTAMKHPWQKRLALETFTQKNTLPEHPGVYFFLGEGDKILYIGKATSLRDRVKSYFSQDLLVTRGPKVSLMLPDIRAIGYTETDSVLEALILEAELIKRIQPLFNTDSKDDKSYNQVVITREKFPRVLIVRSRDIANGKFTAPVKAAFGPFPEGGALRVALKIVRQLFPFRDLCTSFDELTAAQKEKARPCFSTQIGLCPGVCVGAISQKEYAKHIRNIRLFFSGKKSALLNKLEREMLDAAQEERFEEAARIKKTIFGLKHIQDMALIKQHDGEGERHRIEAFDVAHLRGKESVGVMTVVQRSIARPENYRQFRLRGKHNGNDLTALEEVLRRRFRHPEWPFPELIVVDGSVAQQGVAERALADLDLSIPILGVVKNARHQPERIIGPGELAVRFKREALLANSEAHRFAISFHRRRLRRGFLPAKKA